MGRPNNHLEVTSKHEDMKYFISLLISISALTSSSQPGITSHAWQEDLEFLQEKINGEFSHLFYRTTRESFNKRIEELIARIPMLERHEIILGITSIIADFKIGHTAVQLVQNKHGNTLNTGFTQLPVRFYLFKDGLYIEGAHQSQAKLPGAKVLKIGNIHVANVLDTLRSIVSVENESYFKAYGVPLLACPQILHGLGLIPDLEEVQLLVNLKGQERLVRIDARQNFDPPTHFGFTRNTHDWVSARKGQAPPTYLKEPNKNYTFEYFPDSKILYVRHSLIRDDPEEMIPVFFNRVFEFERQHDVEKLVLDLRLNQGGDGYKNKPVVLGLIKSQLNIDGKLFTITGRHTFSAAQNLVNQLEKYTETIFVGEPTAQNVNSFGDARQVTLPNSQLQIMLSQLWWQEMDPRDKRLATKPDIPVEMTYQEYSTGQDPVLQAIRNYGSSPLGKLSMIRQYYLTGRYEEAEEAAGLLFASNSHELNLSTKLNTMGYDFIGQGNLPAAQHVLRLNTELYPHCANCWDSLGEIYLLSGKPDQALEYYQKAYDMDPQGRVGAHARAMIHRIKAHLYGE